jgi:single-stranded-DNA-specific exonuclease
MENWVIKNRKADFEQISRTCGISEVMARCLVNKGLENPEDIKVFLNPELKGMHNPLFMKDMNKALEILKEKIKAGKKIRIIGDYDVDGVVATYILYRTLSLIGADVDYDIPDRIKDGYGINNCMVDKAHEAQVDTILTCDNGIVAVDQVLLAKKYNMTVIITDHHSLLETDGKEVILPEADAIINPKQPDCSYPYKCLCGAAIAYKLVTALLHFYEIPKKSSFQEELLAYTAIATVCDVMELTDENRIIVRHGLQLLKKTRNKGLLGLIDLCQIDIEQLSAFHLGYIIGPCLNASGRLNTARKGLELLLAQSEETAVSLAREVKELNDVRKEMTADNAEKAIRLIEESDLDRDKILVVYLPECHESIAGIIAGRVKERYNKPSIVLTDAQDCIKGSARSIEQYNMIEELSRCRDLLLKVGGHPMAAGLSVMPENVEPLRKRLNENTSLTEEKSARLLIRIANSSPPILAIISSSLIQDLKTLASFISIMSPVRCP